MAACDSRPTRRSLARPATAMPVPTRTSYSGRVPGCRTEGGELHGVFSEHRKVNPQQRGVLNHAVHVVDPVLDCHTAVAATAVDGHLLDVVDSRAGREKQP